MNDAMVNLLKMATHVFQAKVKLQSIVCLRSMGRAPESPLSMGPERPRYAPLENMNFLDNSAGKYVEYTYLHCIVHGKLALF